MSCTAGLERRDYLDFLPKRPQGTTKILGTPAFAGTKTPAALKFPSKGATTDCVETPVNCPHCGQKWRLRRRLRRQPFILLSFSSSKKARKAQKTQSYQRIQHTDHTAVNTSGTTGPRLPSPPKAGTHSALLKGIAHKGLHGETGAFRTGLLLLPSDCFTRFGNPAWPGGRTANFAAFGSWPGVLSKNAESLRDSDALMRVAVPRRRGPAGLRDLFRFCRNCGLYILRSGLSACARHGWYHYPRRALRASETLDARLSKGLICRFLRSGGRSSPHDSCFLANTQNFLPTAPVANTFALWYNESKELGGFGHDCG